MNYPKGALPGSRDRLFNFWDPLSNFGMDEHRQFKLGRLTVPVAITLQVKTIDELLQREPLSGSTSFVFWGPLPKFGLGEVSTSKFVHKLTITIYGLTNNKLPYRKTGMLRIYVYNRPTTPNGVVKGFYFSG